MSESDERSWRRKFETVAPTLAIPGDDKRRPEEAAGLCLSGGGYRAMVFHIGTLRRLNEAGILRGLARISSVSGGSITAGVLGLNWSRLEWDDNDVATNFVSLVEAPIRRLASTTIDRSAILWGVVSFSSIGNRIAKRYRKILYGNATLQDLPADGEGPRFVINATNLQTGVLWRFSNPYMADYTVGLVRRPRVNLATAVAASSAFPPLLSPVVLKLDPNSYAPDPKGRPRNADHRGRIVLTDGGVYDNMGLETVWKRYRTVLVSDAGGGGGWWSRKAGRNWFRQFWRVFWIQRYQVGRVRRRQLIRSYELEPDDQLSRRGAYWGIGTKIKNYGLNDALPAPFKKTQKLRDESTRLKKMPARRQEELINWGYAVCDAALRKHVDESLPAPTGFPYADVGVGS